MNQKNEFNQFQNLLNGEVKANMPGILLHIEYPDKNMSWSGVAGVSDKKTGDPLKTEHQFRIASVTKTFVACAVLRLWEDEKLQLDDPIQLYISAEHIEILRRGGYEVDRITIRHLLTHSSGLFDHTNSNNFVSKIMEDPQYEWTRTEQILIAATDGKPIAPVSERFSYSDTGYILLGEIIEQINGSDLDNSLRELLVFEHLGMPDTRIENGRHLINENRLHQYMDGVDIYDFNPTMDIYGGGGLLSTAHDLAIFFQSLFNHKIFRKKSTLDTMLQPVPYTSKPDKDYRMGIFLIQVEGLDAYTHTGFWGTQVIYLPEYNASIATNYSQIWVEKGTAPILTRIVKVLNAEKSR
jgi:D-alanyl-D-alanine carboxypeptidase